MEKKTKEINDPSLDTLEDMKPHNWPKQILETININTNRISTKTE